MEFSRQEYWSIAIPFSRGSSRPRDGPWVSRLAGRFFTSDPSEEGRELGDGKAERLSAIGGGGQAAVSLMPDADGPGSATLLEPDSCSHLWKFATWQFACRGCTIFIVSSGLRWKSQGPLHWTVQPFSEWRLGFNTQNVYIAFPFSPGGPGDWQYYNFFCVLWVRTVWEPSQIQREVTQALHCFLQSTTSHYQAADPSKWWRDPGGAVNTCVSSLDPQKPQSFDLNTQTPITNPLLQPIQSQGGHIHHYEAHFRR